MTGAFPFANLLIYGPPGSGKSTVGKLLAGQLGWRFTDLDEQIAVRSGRTIPEIFQQSGETSFRRAESELLHTLLSEGGQVIALGGGALLDPENRRLAETTGQVVCLSAPLEVLAARLRETSDRPLLAGDATTRLATLLEARAAHYASFPHQVAASAEPTQVAWEVQTSLGFFLVHGMGAPYPVAVMAGGLAHLGEYIATLNLVAHRAMIVSDTQVAAHYAAQVAEVLLQSGIASQTVTFPAGEASKTIATLQALWSAFLDAGLDRKDLVIALGGGVVSDLAGFAAATYMRGIAWLAVPTSLLAMVDASLGGKTGCDLPQGKNLVGAFHPPVAVLADPHTLATLPGPELRAGLGEVVKHAVIGDPGLLDLLTDGLPAELEPVVRRAMAVKIRIIQQDPLESGLREALNFGHTIGHALEAASNYRLRHGEAVALGMLAEARLAESIGLAQPGLAQQIADVLRVMELPTEVPKDLDLVAIRNLTGVDKKRRQGHLRFALPVSLGEVRTGVEIPDWETRLVL